MTTADILTIALAHACDYQGGECRCGEHNVYADSYSGECPCGGCIINGTCQDDDCHN